MASVRDVLLYFCTHYPHKSELSKARLTKMVYLADWRSAITVGSQMTGLQWTFNHYGPYLEEVVAVARKSDELDVRQTVNMYGSKKEVVVAKPNAPHPRLTPEERSVLDHVIKTTQNMTFNDFINLVYSTYPIASQERYHDLDLVKLAKEYKSLSGVLGG